MVLRWLKRAAIFIAIFIALIIGILLFMHTGMGRSIVRNQVQAYLQNKWNTKVSIGNIDYRLPNWIALERVMILDHNKDTLLSGGRIYAGIRLMDLLANSVNVTGVKLENINLNCRREAANGEFNFQFI